jgi:type II secretory pathway pseudopilin PulG
MPRQLQHQRSALSLFEVVASTMIVGLMAVAALQTLGAATRSADSLGNRAVALGLADELMSEILQTAYNDPNQTPTFGRETGETAGLRSAFDDVDDYNGYSQSPPKYRDGTTIPDRTNWSQKVTVAYVQPGNPVQATAGNTDQGAKRVKVAIEYNGRVLAEQYALRTDTD